MRVVLGERVLIKQTMTAKSRQIIMAKGVDDKDKWDFDFEIVQLGSKVPTDEIKVGDKPVLGQFAQFNTVSVIEKSDRKMVVLAVVHYEDIIGLE